MSDLGNMRHLFTDSPSIITRWLLNTNNDFQPITVRKRLANETVPLDFEYAEADVPENEIAELYSYSERTELAGNAQCMREFLKRYKRGDSTPKPWTSMETREQSDIILMLLNQLDHKNAAERLEASRCILYIAQGCWEEYTSPRKWFRTVRLNVILLHHHKVFDCFVQQFNLEAGKKKRKPSNMFDTEALRIILNVLYTLVDVVRWDNNKMFCDYLRTDDLVALIVDLFKLLGYLSEYVVPVKKIVLLIWKLLLVLLGGLDVCNTLKQQKRMEANLPPNHDYGFVSAKLKPKVYQHFFNERLMESRKKHIPDLKLFNDNTTLAGLPQPEIISLNKLKSYIYVPLGQLQMEHEEKLYNHPLTHQEDVEETPAELLYSAMLPELKRNMTILLYITSTTNMTASFNSLNESIKLPSISDQLIVKVDIQRHNEIILKAISNIILLLLKHFKANHILQFEHISQLLFNLEATDVIIMLLMHNKLEETFKNVNEFPDWKFPNSVLCFGPTQTTISWRNTATTINWLRIINKLTKWKHGRLLHLFSFNIEDVMAPLARVQNNHVKLYSLKLIKMVLKYTRKTWVKMNMDLITDMYYLVRSQLDTRYLNTVITPIITGHGGIVNSRQEKSLAWKIARFNRRRYESDRERLAQWEPMDNLFLSVLGSSNSDVEENFKKHYEAWLKKEVFSK